jgi:outer membrane protein, heavy metal efflux system
MRRHHIGDYLAVALALTVGVAERAAWGQAPANPLDTSPIESGALQPRTRSAPGSGAMPSGASPGAGAEFVGGRPGTSTPRVPTTITTPGAGYAAPPAGGLAPPPTLPLGNPPLYGPLVLPTGPEEEGPAHGLTLDMAIDRLVHENLYLRSQFFDIPQALADILTASLRANPFLYFDSQLVPYGQYSNQRPGGQLQYDLNVTYPLDLSHKRRARMLVATRAKYVLEAQYQDAVRTQIDNLYRAFIDVLAARETIRLRQTSLIGLKNLLQVTQTYYQKASATRVDVAHVELLRDSAELLLASDDEALRRANRVLAALLAFPPAEADQLELRGSIHDRAPPPPMGDALIEIALAERPDLRSFRLGVGRAEADVRLARANRFQDVYVLYQPYTFQNNEPIGLKSATSWALGLTVPLPLYNRNQGNIQRSRLNLGRTQAELLAVVRQVITEVQNAEREYTVSQSAVRRIEDTMLGKADTMRKDSLTLFTGGETDVVAHLNNEREYNDMIRLYIETLIRHRRAMLSLNTAVGRRLLP